MLNGLLLFAKGQTTDFTFRSEGDLYCAPVEVQFTQTSSGRPKGYLWDFGNGIRSNAANPAITFNNPGTFTVRLITVYENSTAEKSRTITINRPVTSSFTVDREELCQPGTVQFTASGSSNIVRREWNFGDGSPVQSANATTISHAYTNFGTYNITLTSYNADGCSSSSSRSIRINQPVLSGTRTPTMGCAPVTCDFSASISLPAGTTVTRYDWNFGDGAIISGNNPQVSHTYSGAGAYAATVSIQTNSGCTASYRFDSVYFGTPPITSRAYTATPVVCGSDKAKFVAIAQQATSYDWDFGNGNIVSTTDTFVERKFSALGFHQVLVTPKYYDCPGTTDTLQVEVVGVIAKFLFNNTCADRKTFSFRNNSVGNITSMVWEIGEPVTQQYTSTDIRHRFPNNGATPVRLKLEDNVTGCVDSANARIFTADPWLVASGRSICINSDARFRIDRNYTNPNATYTWNVLGETTGAISQSELTVMANLHGLFQTNYVIINNGNAYCPDTVSLNFPINVKGPLLNFTAPENTCLNQALLLTNQSRPFYPTDTIQSWQWTMGDNQGLSNSFTPDPYFYQQPRAYNVSLTAVDINGCRDTLTKRISIRPMPFLWIIPRNDTICQGQSSSFIAYTSDDLLWSSTEQLSFCSTCDTVTVTPLHDVFFRVSATNQYQCVSYDSASVHVIEPFTARSAMADTAICLNERLRLDADPKDKVIEWSPADQMSEPNVYNPMVSPRQTTTYIARLSDSTGCFSSQTQVKVIVKSNPTVDPGPDRNLSYGSPFTFQPRYSNNVRQYLWAPGDSLNCAICPNPSGFAFSSKRYTVTVTSDSGCTAKSDVNIFVECKGANILMPKAFSPNNDRLNDRFYPIARGLRSIQRFSVFNRMGEPVFEARNFLPNNPNNGWDGLLRGSPQARGAYVYFIEAVCETGQIINVKGSVLLVR